MRHAPFHRASVHFWLAAFYIIALSICTPCQAGEPDPKTYWDVKDLRPGMKGVGKTVMVGTKLEEFGAEVLGVMRDVSPRARYGSLPLDGLQPRTCRHHPGDEWQPDLHRR